MRAPVWIALACAAGCEGNGVQGGPDAAIVIDAPASDAQPLVDAPPPDSRLVDAALPDAAPRDAAPPDAMRPDAMPANPFCTTDDTAGLVAGARETPIVSDMITLCNGQIVMGDLTANRVVVEDVIRGDILDTYALPAPPGDMDLDAQAGVVYVAVPNASALARIDLAAGTQTIFLMPAPVGALAAGPRGKLFLVGQGGLDVVDGATGTIVQSAGARSTYDRIAYDAVNQQVIAAGAGSLFRYSVDPPTVTLAFQQGVGTTGENCLDLVESPLGNHLANTCGTGNAGTPYQVLDIATTDLSVVWGAWDVGPYPSGADFAPDGASVAISNMISHVKTYSVATHAMAATYTPTTSCSGTNGFLDIRLVRYSRGGHLVYAYMRCDPTGNTGSVAWMIVP